MSFDIEDPYQSFISKSRYARWLESEGRRERWSETVNRYVDYMAAKVPDIDVWEEARESINSLDVMPSMRALMVAGPALDRCHVAGYNCSFLAIDSPRAFDEAMYILMCGTGVGFSAEQRFTSKLPLINEHFEKSASTVKVQDSKQGWAKAFREIIAMLYAGQIPSVDISEVRPSGARLKTFGGRASGPQPLVDLFDFAITMFKGAAGRQLKPIECHDLMCKVGEVVVVGGVRRSALISLTDLSDFEMSKAKSGAWWDDHPERALANNSAVYSEKPTVAAFLEEWTALFESKSGERGIFNRGLAQDNRFSPRRDTSKVLGTNPCGEINLRSNGFCNLSEVVVKAEDTLESLEKKVRIATAIGTAQSSLTNFKYLRKIWKDNAEEERLLGVSLTGVFGHPVMSGSLGIEKLEEWLDVLREAAIDANTKYSDALGINQSVAITTVKPSGTVSQLTNSSSGMHPWHSQYYLRTVRGDNKDPLTQLLKAQGVPSEPDVMNPEHTTVFYFPRKAPEGAITRNDLTALEHLEVWKTYKTHWTEHNPSVTISVRDHEWVSVAAWVYENWDVVGGISFLPHSDHTYKQAPYQDCSEDTYNEYVDKSPDHLDWVDLGFYELEDTTTGSQTLACSSGACELVDISK